MIRMTIGISVLNSSGRPIVYIDDINDPVIREFLLSEDVSKYRFNNWRCGKAGCRQYEAIYLTDFAILIERISIKQNGEKREFIYRLEKYLDILLNSTHCDFNCEDSTDLI